MFANSVCYDADLIQKLEQVYDKFNLLKELIENSNNENSKNFNNI